MREGWAWHNYFGLAMASLDVVDVNNGGEHAIEDLNDQELQEP